MCLGSKPQDSEINELRVTRVNGKKATRPCPCGHAGDPLEACRCPPDRINNYRHRISGPLLDRLDMVVSVPRLTPAEMVTRPKEPEELNKLQEQVASCRQRQQLRSGKTNSALQVEELDAVCQLDPEADKLLRTAVDRLHLSARAYHRILRLARTIADFSQREQINAADLSEAVAYRWLDKNGSAARLI